MGNVRTSHIKILSERLIELHPDKFSEDYDKNKENLDGLMTFDSKTIRNKVAGYITHSVDKLKKLDSLKVTYQNPEPDKKKKKKRKRS
ncbi:MAG: 30S ribosomal protein S17e [Candidatus Aenigmarchaeota archaeon]|nr:30S ribosomal protein S17e [Candidatus Aenigmarchaeota archaeon]